MDETSPRRHQLPFSDHHNPPNEKVSINQHSTERFGLYGFALLSWSIVQLARMDINSAALTLNVALSLVLSPYFCLCLDYLFVPLLMCVLCCGRDREHKLEACLLGIGYVFGRMLVALDHFGYLTTARCILMLMPWILVLARKAVRVQIAVRNQQQGLVHDVYQNTTAMCIYLSHMDALC